MITSAPLLIAAALVQSGVAEFEFPTYPIATRSAGLGRAGVAVPQDAAADLNPAAVFGAVRVSLHRFQGYAGYAGTLLAGQVPIGPRLAVGVSLRRFGWDNVVQDDLGPGTAGLSASQTQAAMTGAIGIGNWLAAGARVSRMSADNLGIVTGATSYSFGALVRYASRGAIGLALRDAGHPARPPGGDVGYPLPTRVRVGVSQGLRVGGHVITVVADAESRRGDFLNPGLHLGLEWRPDPVLALRAGFENVPSAAVPDSRIKHVATGLGLRLGKFELGLAARSAGSGQGYELYLGLDAFP